MVAVRLAISAFDVFSFTPLAQTVNSGARQVSTSSNKSGIARFRVFGRIFALLIEEAVL